MYQFRSEPNHPTPLPSRCCMCNRGRKFSHINSNNVLGNNFTWFSMVYPFNIGSSVTLGLRPCSFFGVRVLDLSVPRSITSRLRACLRRRAGVSTNFQLCWALVPMLLTMFPIKSCFSLSLKAMIII